MGGRHDMGLDMGGGKAERWPSCLSPADPEMFTDGTDHLIWRRKRSHLQPQIPAQGSRGLLGSASGRAGSGSLLTITMVSR